MSELHKFLFEGQAVRGMLVRLTDDWREALRRRSALGEFATPVRELLGEMAAAGVLLQAGIRFDGALVLQIAGDGPVKLAVVEVQNDLAFRATAKVVAELPEQADLQSMTNAHGRGRCAITLDPADKSAGQQPYQGVVSLVDGEHRPLATLAEVVAHYMRQSEQLDTHLVLAANDELAAGLLVQRLPAEGGAAGLAAPPDDDAYERIATLAATLGRDELLTLPVDTLLHRLFWEEDLRRFEPLAPRFACTCSRERVRGMLRGLGEDEVRGIVDERGVVEIGCEFCGQQYRFDAVDAAELFTPDRDHPPGSSAVQ
jgi:molecular chaperone Hsp33